MAVQLERLTRAKYSGLDFDTHGDDLRARLQVKFASDFNDLALSSLGIVLLDTVSFGLDTLSFYLDRRATDTFLETARTRKSVARLTRQLGYKMRAAIASSVDLDIFPKAAFAFVIPIPKGFQFQGPNGLIFETARYVEFPAASTATISVPCFEGQTLSETFTSDGSVNQVFTLRKVPAESAIVDSSVVVTVDGTPFEEKEFLEFDKSDQFEAGLNDDPPVVRFGDATTGNVPIKGASIVVTYIASKGKNGLAAKATITQAVSPLVVAFQTIPLSINNPKPSVGGDDPETLEHAKIFAGRVYKSRFVAITRQDYEALAGSYADPLFGRVAVAQAISSRSAIADLLLQTLLSDINSAVTALKPTIDAATTDATTRLDAIDTQIAVLSDNENDIASKTAQIGSNADSIILSARSSRNRSLDIQAEVVSGKAAIDAIPVGADALSLATAADLKVFFDSIDTSAAAVGSNSDATVTTAGDTKDQSLAVGDVFDVLTALPTSSKTNLEKAATARKAITAAVGIVGPPSTALRKDVEDIITINVDTTIAVAAATAALAEHVDQILAADCKANLVSIPVLVRDANGFYVAPSIGMVKSLQTFLDSRKEVTQTVAVMSGGNFLIPAVITARVGVNVGISESTTKTSVETAMDGILRDRVFGASLFVSALVDASLAVEGVSFVNITINGYSTDGGVTVESALNDVEGNLIILDTQVVTKGVITIVTEVAKQELSQDPNT